LSQSILRLINASIDLDHQTESDLKKLHKLLPPPPPHPPHKHHDCGKKPLKLVWYKFCSTFSSKCEKKLAKHHPDHHGHPEPPKLPKKKVAEIKKILEAIRAGNKKRQAFEGGFISEDGIKVCPAQLVLLAIKVRILIWQEREWYKHKVTAPGLWLGYGATTFPAITEGELLPLTIFGWADR
jgi:N-acetylated-alpha-linked acidic dipeptidase